MSIWRALIPGGLITALGALAIITGLVLFGQAMLTPNEVFFASPNDTMNDLAARGFGGIALFAFGGLTSMVGLVVALVSAVITAVRRSERQSLA